jgi:hypothetical protein
MFVLSGEIGPREQMQSWISGVGQDKKLATNESQTGRTSPIFGIMLRL